MKILKFAFVVLLAISMVACSPVSSGIIDGTSPTVSNQLPSKSYSNIDIVTPTPATTLSPSVTVTPNEPEVEDLYFYTIDGVGNSKYPYAWTDEVPAQGPIEYGVLDSDDVKAIQTRLTQLGFYCSVANGSFNQRTLTAVNEFQDMIGMERTSNITQEFIDVIFSPDGIKELALTEYQITEDVLSGMTVFIDAGHGGDDTGTARGALVEREITIEQSYRMKTMLEEAGARVFMIRSGTSQVSLAYRSGFTNYIIMSDIIDETNAEISELNEKLSKRNDISDKTAQELKSEIDLILQNISEVLSKITLVNSELNEIIAQYGNLSDEYKDKLAEKTELENQASLLAEQKSLLNSMYYSSHMDVSADVFIQYYEDKIEELTEYVKKIQHYKDLFEISVNDPSVEFSGLYQKSYDENGDKVINPELEKALDIIGSYCDNRYAFISVHVNGVDNAPDVNGTEIYVQSNGSGINKNYYLNYNENERAALAASLKNAMDEVLPLNSGKQTRIKYSDLFVLRETNVPCILLELGYVTNIGDRVSMLTPEVRNKFAYSIYEGLCDYFLS